MLVDISRERFELVYLGESHMSIDFSLTTAHRLILDVWGVTLPLSVYGLEAYGLTESTRPFNDDIYVSGFSRLIFDQVIGGHMDVELFSYGDSPDKLHWPDKALMKLTKTWGKDNLASNDSIYEVEATLISPYGRCDLSVATQAKVSLEFNESFFVPVREYILNTKKYGWNCSKGLINPTER